MTVALNDVVMLRSLFGELPEGGLRDWAKVRGVGKVALEEKTAGFDD